MKILRVIFVIAVLCAPFYAQQVNQDIVPASPGLYLGHTNQRWNGYFNNADIYNLTINGSPIGTAGIGLPQISIPNGTNCTTLNGLVEFDGNGQAQTASLSSAKVIGVAVSGAGCSGNVLVQYAAIVNCTTDGSTLINDRIAASNSIPGDCMDIGPISIPGIQTVGLVTAVSSGAGQLTSFDLFTGDTISPSSSSGSGVVSVSPCIGPFGYAATAAAIVSWDCNTSLDGSGNAGFKKVTVTGSGAGKIDFGSSTTPGNPSAGFFRLYADSGTGFLTCLTSTGTSCLSSGTAFSAITGATNTSAAMKVGTTSSLSPVTPAQAGQIVGTQTWLQPGLSAPVAVSSNTGGSLISGHATAILYTLNSVLGETLPSTEVAANNIGGFGAGCASGSACSITVTAPTIPSGYTGYTVYSRDCNTLTGCAGSELKQTASANCANITINCVIQVGGAGASFPTTNTAVITPPNVQATNGALGFIPSVFFPKADGNYYPWFGVEWNSCDAVNGPSSVCGTPMFTHRTWFNDNPANTPVGGKNAFIVIDHLTGKSTLQTNQDRALWVNEQNPSGDASQHYSFAGIQTEVDVLGAPTWQAAVDSEVAAFSGQVSDQTTNNNGPNSVAVARFSWTRANTGGSLTNSGVVAGVKVDFTNNSSTAFSAGTIWTGFQWAPTNSSTLTNLIQVGNRFTMLARGASAQVIGTLAGGGSFTPTAGSDWFARNDIHNWHSMLNGGVWLNGISASDQAVLPINASTNTIGSVTVTPITTGFTSGIGSVTCSGGASTYGYTLVAVDNNGGQVASAQVSSSAACVNPLTAPNPATLNNPSPAGMTTNPIWSQAVRLDVYRTFGPMGFGKIGSITCNNEFGVLGCTNFVDTGIVAGAALPTGNTTGTSVAYLFGTSTNCAAVGSGASPSVAACGSASAGSFSCATTAVTNCTVNTTAVTANSQIFISQREDATTGTRLSVTCNVTPSTVNPNAITAVVAGTSFTFGLTQPVTNPDCFSYFIVNQ